MNNCPEIVQQATEGSFPWIIVLVTALVAAAIFVYKKGLLGTATEGRIKAKLQAVEETFRKEKQIWEDKLQAKLSKKPAAPAEVVAPTDMVAALTAAKASLDANLITQADYDAIKAKYLP